MATIAAPVIVKKMQDSTASDTPKPKYSRGPRRGIGTYSCTTPSTANIEKVLASIDTLFGLAYIVADLNNSAAVYVGNQGEEVLGLNAGDIVPFLDVAPADFWCTSASASQKVYFIGSGSPGA